MPNKRTNELCIVVFLAQVTTSLSRLTCDKFPESYLLVARHRETRWRGVRTMRNVIIESIDA